MLGDYAYQFYVIFANELQFIMAALFFCLSLRRKDRFLLRLLLGLTAGDVILAVAVYLRTIMDSLFMRIIVTMLQYAFTLPLMMLCFEEDITLILKSWGSSIAVKEIVGTIYPVLQVILGYDPHTTLNILPLFDEAYTDLNWMIYLGMHLLMYWVIWFVLRRHISREPLGQQSRLQALILSAGSVLLLSVLGAVTSHYRDESLALFICSRIFTMTVAVFILLQYAGLEFRSRAGEDMAMMERILSEERKQYQQIKESIDIINMRCHDLKHQLADFSGRLTDREISEMQEAMDIYERNIRTGCEALDVVLFIHQMACRQEGITLTCLADGEALSFMRTRHIYALFNNAISNAMEAVRRIGDPEKRVVGLTVAREEGNVAVEVVNYYEGQVPSAGETTKADKVHHGFGTMSMRYIVRQYGGELITEARGGMYTLRAVIPIPESAPEKS